MERARSEKAEVREATGRAGIANGSHYPGASAADQSYPGLQHHPNPCGLSRRRCEGWRPAAETCYAGGAQRRDEIGAMARAIEVFRRNAEEMEHLKALDEIKEREHKEEFAARLSGLANALELEVQLTVMAVMEQVSGIADLAERMKEAAGRTGEQSSGVAEAAREATAGAHSVAAASEELARTSNEIGYQMSEVDGIIRNAVTKSEDTCQVVAALNDAAQSIGNVVGLNRRDRRTDQYAGVECHHRSRAGRRIG